jgi:hypothetical protein
VIILPILILIPRALISGPNIHIHVQ